MHHITPALRHGEHMQMNEMDREGRVFKLSIAVTIRNNVLIMTILTMTTLIFAYTLIIITIRYISCDKDTVRSFQASSRWWRKWRSSNEPPVIAIYGLFN